MAIPLHYSLFEKEAIRASLDVYNSPLTTTSRNEKTIYTTAYSCSDDIIEIACELAEVDNVQEAVKRELPRKSAEDDK